MLFNCTDSCDVAAESFLWKMVYFIALKRVICEVLTIKRTNINQTRRSVATSAMANPSEFPLTGMTGYNVCRKILGYGEEAIRVPLKS